MDKFKQDMTAQFNCGNYCAVNSAAAVIAAYLLYYIMAVLFCLYIFIIAHTQIALLFQVCSGKLIEKFNQKLRRKKML